MHDAGAAVVADAQVLHVHDGRGPVAIGARELLAEEPLHPRQIVARLIDGDAGLHAPGAAEEPRFADAHQHRRELRRQPHVNGRG